MIPSETNSPETTAAPSSPKSWRDSQWLPFVEFLTVALIFCGNVLYAHSTISSNVSEFVASTMRRTLALRHS